MDAKYMPSWARQVCRKHFRMTPRTYEVLDNRAIGMLNDDDPVMIVRNSRREVTLKAWMYHHYWKYDA